jgi:chromosome segregation ATPase
VALHAQADALKNKVADYERAVSETEVRLVRERNEADAAAKELAAERTKADALAGRVAQLERQLVVQTTETEILGRRVHELEGRLADQGRLLAEREYECDRLRAAVDVARKAESDLRMQLAGGGTDDARARASALRADIEREIGPIERDADTGRAAERAENAFLRERIGEVAAEIARLTAALEGPGSRIDAILAKDASLAPEGVNGPVAAEAENRPGRRDEAISVAAEPASSLADRIRALQTRAPRVASRN